MTDKEFFQYLYIARTAQHTPEVAYALAQKAYVHYHNQTPAVPKEEKAPRKAARKSTKRKEGSGT